MEDNTHIRSALDWLKAKWVYMLFSKVTNTNRHLKKEFFCAKLETKMGPITSTMRLKKKKVKVEIQCIMCDKPSISWMKLFPHFEQTAVF